MRITKHKRRWMKLLATLLAIPSLAACTDTDTVTFGATVQLTGNLSGAGRSYRDAYQIAVEKINEKGGIAIGDIRYRLALKIVDNASDPNLSSQQHVDL